MPYLSILRILLLFALLKLFCQADKQTYRQLGRESGCCEHAIIMALTSALSIFVLFCAIKSNLCD